MGRGRGVTLVGGMALLLLGGSAQARQPHAGAAAGDAPEYAVDAITVATPGRDATPPSTLCIVWADAESLGVGPAQLGGLHGLSLTLDLSGPSGTTLDQALAAAKTAFPSAPEWLLSAVRAQGGPIARACGGAHADPVLITKLTSKSRAP